MVVWLAQGLARGHCPDCVFPLAVCSADVVRFWLCRLRDLSTQDKLEHQRAIKDLDKSSQELNQLREQKEKLAQELQVVYWAFRVFRFVSSLPPSLLPFLPTQEADEVIDELKEQVDAALGAEEMVEKLTDTNLELEEKMEKLNETVADLEALRDLSEEQEELRMEVEHDLREELDMNLNNVREVGVVRKED